MDAYVLGRHDGDLPAHLLEEGEPGHRVRAMARLEGPTHDAYYALEVPEPSDMERLVQRLIDAGTNIRISFPHCLTPPCHVITEGISHRPSWLPGPDNFLAFLWLDSEQISDAAAAAQATLGVDGVAAAADGEGHVLVELGGNDEAAVREAAAQFEQAATASAGVHAVSAEGLLRA